MFCIGIAVCIDNCVCCAPWNSVVGRNKYCKLVVRCCSGRSCTVSVICQKCFARELIGCWTVSQVNRWSDNPIFVRTPNVYSQHSWRFTIDSVGAVIESAWCSGQRRGLNCSCFRKNSALLFPASRSCERWYVKWFVPRCRIRLARSGYGYCCVWSWFSVSTNRCHFYCIGCLVFCSLYGVREIAWCQIANNSIAFVCCSLVSQSVSNARAFFVSVSYTYRQGRCIFASYFRLNQYCCYAFDSTTVHNRDSNVIDTSSRLSSDWTIIPPIEHQIVNWVCIVCR